LKYTLDETLVDNSDHQYQQYDQQQ